MISPTWLLKAGISKGAISLPYIQSKADLSESVFVSDSFASFSPARLASPIVIAVGARSLSAEASFFID